MSKTWVMVGLGLSLYCGTTGNLNGCERRILFQGDQTLALQSSGVAAVVSGQSLNDACPTCVPGGSSSANYGAGVPNQIVTFLHPYCNQAISIPLTLPPGKPKVKVKRDRIVYDYGFCSYKVTVHFLPDGKVEVIYKD